MFEFEKDIELADVRVLGQISKSREFIGRGYFDTRGFRGSGERGVGGGRVAAGGGRRVGRGIRKSVRETVDLSFHSRNSGGVHGRTEFQIFLFSTRFKRGKAFWVESRISSGIIFFEFGGSKRILNGF